MSDKAGPFSRYLRRILAISAAASFLAIAFVLAAPWWRVTSSWGSASAVSTIHSYEGIFLTCVQSTGFQGNNQCFQLPMYFTYNSAGAGWYGSSTALRTGVYSYLNAFRALMIIGFICSLVGVVCSILGMKCASIIEEDGAAKRWVLIIGGICHIAAGVLTGVCVSWYAAEVVNEYYNPMYQAVKLKYTLGACLYVGWVAMLFSLITGCMMACCTCFNKPVDDPYKYSPSKQPQQYSYNPEPVAYTKEQPYEHKQTMQYDRRSDYYGKSSSRRHDRASSRHTSRDRDRDRASSRRRDSVSSSEESRSSDGRAKSGHGGSRHDSDLMRASGFV